MRDALTEFGTIAPAVKDTVAYSEDIMDFGSTLEGQTLHTGITPGINVVFSAQADVATTDSVTPQIYHCETSNGTYTLCASGTKVTAPKKGQHLVVAMPKSHYRYVKTGIMPSSTGTFTTKNFESWIENGEMDESI